MRYRWGVIAAAALAATAPSAEAAKRKPVFRASCAAPAKALADGTGTATLKIVRGAGSVRIASVSLASGQPASSTAFTLTRAGSGFRFAAKRLDGATRTVRHRIRIAVHFVRTGGRVVTTVVTCQVVVQHTQQAVPPAITPPVTTAQPSADSPPPPPPPEPPPPPAVQDYVALGDSAASGVGTGVYAEPTCRRSDASYPRLIDVAHPDTDLVFAACSGATIQDVRTAQLASLGTGTDLVTVTVGANDVGFATVMGACAGGSNSACATAIADANTAVADTLPGRLTTLFTEIRAAAPAATVVVAGYPRLFSGTTCGTTGLVNAGEQGQINATIDAVRDASKARAEAAGFAYADPIPAFTGHALCAAEPWLTGADVASNEAFHPTATGYQAYATAIRAIIG